MDLPRKVIKKITTVDDLNMFLLKKWSICHSMTSWHIQNFSWCTESRKLEGQGEGEW